MRDLHERPPVMLKLLLIYRGWFTSLLLNSVFAHLLTHEDLHVGFAANIVLAHGDEPMLGAGWGPVSAKNEEMLAGR